MNKVEAINKLEQYYSDLKVYSIIEDPDMFVAQMTKKNGEVILGSTKGVMKNTGKVIEVSPLKHAGLVTRLMDKSAVIESKKRWI